MSRSEEKIKVGSLVFMTREGRKAYEDDLVNPHDEIGILNSNDEEDWGDYQIYEVKWIEGTNTYRPGDIQVIEDFKDFIQPLKAGKVEPTFLRALESGSLCD